MIQNTFLEIRAGYIAIFSLSFPCSRETLYSHSIVLSHGNALIFRGKFFLRILKNRIPDPSEICTLEIKGEFR